jgi:hypothetical protein
MMASGGGRVAVSPPLRPAVFAPSETWRRPGGSALRPRDARRLRSDGRDTEVRQLIETFGEFGTAAADRVCCSEEQVVLLIDYGLFMATCLLLWYSRILMPLKLFTTFLHELGHAVAVWLTCNKVHSIEVHADQGGVTKWSTTRLRFSNHFVLPAGYLGSAAWGGAILVCSVASQEAAYAITFVLMFFLLVALGYSICAGTGEQGCTLPALSIGLLVIFSALLSVCFFTEWQHRDLLLRECLLLVGVMNTLFSTYDIWTDCIARTIERSDAYKYAELLGCCCNSVCIGVIWLVTSLILAGAMLYLALSLMPSEPEFDGSFSTASITSIVAPTAVLGAAVVFRCACSKTYGGKLTRGIVLEDDGEDARLPDTGSNSSGSGGAVMQTTGHHWAGHNSDSNDEESDDSDDSGDE